MLTRRSFLRGLGLSVPVAVIAPTYFFAPKNGWHSEVVFNSFVYKVSRDFYSDKPHLVVSGRLLEDLGRVIGLVRMPVETDSELRSRMIRAMERFTV